MRKKTALHIPGNRKASPKQTKGLVAKDQEPRQSAQEECALDNRSHRTFGGGSGSSPRGPLGPLPRRSRPGDEGLNRRLEGMEIIDAFDS